MGTFGNTDIYHISCCRKGPGRPGSQISHIDQTGCSTFNLISYLSGFMAEHGAFSWIWLFLPVHGSLGNNMWGIGVRTQGSGDGGWVDDDSLAQVCSVSIGCLRRSGVLHRNAYAPWSAADGSAGSSGDKCTLPGWCFMDRSLSLPLILVGNLKGKGAARVCSICF